MVYDFKDQLVWSKGQSQKDDIATIISMIDGCCNVVETSEEEDRNGNDYVATLRKGAEILIDVKTRTRGCSRWWKSGEPEFALEKWSVMPGGKYHTRQEKSKTGWTLCEKKQTDMILFKFDADDTKDVFLVGYQLLRMATRRNIASWFVRYKTDVQDSGSWQSEAVFVPCGVVFKAMNEASRGILRNGQLDHVRLSAVEQHQ